MSNSKNKITFTSQFPSLQTSRLMLRQFVEADLKNVYSGLSHPDIIKYYGISFDTLEATKAQMQWFANLEKNGTGIWWAICAADTSEFLGAGGFNDWNQIHRKAEIGFWLLPHAWGAGYMQEAMPALFKFGFNQMKLHRIEGFVETKNENCKKAVAKLDFFHEGTMVDCEVKNDEFISIDIYAKFEKEQLNAG